MKRTVLASLALSVALSVLACAAFAEDKDVNGWQNAKWGMTPDEVQKVLGQPVFFADLAKVCAETCNEGAALQLDDYDLNDQHFVVRLWFSKPDRHLHTVSMYAKQLDGSNGNEFFTRTKNSLEKAYGAPRSVALQHGHFVIKWAMPSTTISLYSNSTDETTIVYEQSTDKETDKQ